MKTRYKIVIVISIIPIIFFGVFMAGPILFMIVGGAYSNFIISNTSNETFEKEFATIPEVAFFIATYPDHTTSHYGDFLGWKMIDHHAENMDINNLHVKKSMLHGGIRIQASCANNEK